jgi:hypothetical protein
VQLRGSVQTPTVQRQRKRDGEGASRQTEDHGGGAKTYFSPEAVMVDRPSVCMATLLAPSTGF